MNSNEYRKQWLRFHKRYERDAFRIFQSNLRRTANQIPFSLLNENNYKELIGIAVNDIEVRNAYLNVYREIGIKHGVKVGKGINRDLKFFTLELFESTFTRGLLEWIINNTGTRITSVKDTLVKYLIKIIADGFEEGRTIQEIARIMQRTINSRSFYRWQALRIARTETTAAANYAATIAGDSSVYVMEKVWISAQDNRVRRRPEDKYDHVDMHNITVDPGTTFNVQGDKLRFPGDPKGKPSNVIQCRCTVAITPKRDKNGDLIFK